MEGEVSFCLAGATPNHAQEDSFLCTQQTLLVGLRGPYVWDAEDGTLRFEPWKALQDLCAACLGLSPSLGNSSLDSKRQFYMKWRADQKHS